MAEANPDAYRDELGKRVKRVRRDLLAADGATVYAYLHPNARALIDRIAAAGVGTVVLDECHHLLDYWAIVLRALIARLDRPYVVGLTATLPSLEDADEYENYTALLGDVDFEIPTPAVIKEGDLAPFRDLAWWVTPTEPSRPRTSATCGAGSKKPSRRRRPPGFTGWLGVLLGGPDRRPAVSRRAARGAALRADDGTERVVRLGDRQRWAGACGRRRRRSPWPANGTRADAAPRRDGRRARRASTTGWSCSSATDSTDSS